MRRSKKVKKNKTMNNKSEKEKRQKTKMEAEEVKGRKSVLLQSEIDERF